MTDLQERQPVEPASVPAAQSGQWVSAQFLCMLAAVALAMLVRIAIERLAGRELADEWDISLLLIALSVGGRLATRVPRAVAGGGVERDGARAGGLRVAGRGRAAIATWRLTWR